MTHFQVSASAVRNVGERNGGHFHPLTVLICFPIVKGRLVVRLLRKER